MKLEAYERLDKVDKSIFDERVPEDEIFHYF